MGDEPQHECGFALLRLLKPWEYYKEKYGTSFYGVNRMHLMMEKQRNRGQDGCGIANVKLDVPPGVKYIQCEKSIDKDPIKDVFERVQQLGSDKLSRCPAEALLPPSVEGGPAEVDPVWVKENVPFTGELLLAHVRYGTDSDNSVDRCHPVMRESNWLTRSLSLAGNFNITNNEDLFSSLVQIGQHPRELSDTVTLLEKIGHFVDKENNDLYVKYSATGQAPRTCFSLIAENINVARILRRASSDWDGGYCIAGLFGHGDAFCLRDPCGIRPAFYMANDEVVVVASEAPLIQTVFGAMSEEVKPLPPGQALVIKRSGKWRLEGVLPPGPLMQCSFERIYFSRGNDAGVYRERQHLGRQLLEPLIKLLEDGGDSLANTVLSFIPNTSELAYNGLVKEAQDYVTRRRTELFQKFMESKHSGEGAGAGGHLDIEEALRQSASLMVRTEKVVHKDAKIRTFIQEDSSRESLTMHAYDVHYGTVRPGEDVLIALDDSIVRGNTLKNAILRSLDRLGPKRIIVLSSCPQIRYPDVYGIDMAKLGDLAAFRAAITLLQRRGMQDVITETYRACRAQLSKSIKDGEFVNHVRRIYEPFTPEEISEQIVEQVTPPGCNAQIGVLFNTVEAVHKAMPEYAGDWYFTGRYPTPGGTKVACRAFVLWFEGSTARCYGVNSALSTARTPVLVLGHGGSEHAIAWKLSQSHEVGCIYVAPGNGGIASHTARGHWHEHDDAEGAGARDNSAPLIPVDLPLTPPHFKEVKDFCRERSIVLAVVGSKQLLLDGLSDALRSVDVPTFGPSQAAAELDTSRASSQSFVRKIGLPEALAQPEGDVLPEVSVLAFSDGTSFSVVPAATQDQKRCHDDDKGPVTDGMGAFAPSPLLGAEALVRLEAEVLRPIFEGLSAENRPFVGCLQTELLLTADGPKVLALRTSITEPVAQAVLPLIDGDLFEVLAACAGGRLQDKPLALREGKSSVAVVVASGGYPGQFQRGQAITGLERALCVPGAHVFHTGTTVETSVDSVPTPSASRSMSRTRTIGSLGGTAPSSQKLMTCGGRVLTVAAVGRSLNEARERAYVAVRAINFTDAFCRNDIAALASLTATVSSRQGVQVVPDKESASQDPLHFTYRAAGVDSEACKAALKSFEPLVRRTSINSGRGDHSPPQSEPPMLRDDASHEVDAGILVSCASAVGTKLKVALRSNSIGGLGVDLVAVCVNDIAARGAEPLFFHDHFSTEKLDGHQAMQLVQGVSDGCVEAGCRLMEAGVAELPGVFAADGCDFVGFAVGMAPKGKLLPNRDAMVKGDVLIALPSSGLHCNGFSLVRAIIRAAGLDYRQAAPFDPTRSLGEALLPPTKIYAKAVLALARSGLLKGATQVTRGGLGHCFDGVLPAGLAAQLQADAWGLPAVLRWLAALGKVPCPELINTFNCGLGMLLIVAAEHQEQAMALLSEQREEPAVVGHLAAAASPNAPRVEVEGAQGAWLMLPELGVSLPFPQVLSSLQDARTAMRRRIMVLAGCEDVMPLQAVLAAAGLPGSCFSVAAVASAHAGCKALATARSAGIKDKVVGDGKFELDIVCEGLDGASVGDAEAGAGGVVDTTEQAALDFSAQLERDMEEARADLLVLLDDVDTSLLSTAFLQRRVGKVLLVHASLLPAFPGRAPLESALRSGVCITGCTVCFLIPGTTGSIYGPQIAQQAVVISERDSVTTLRQRIVAEGEAKALPRAVQLVASGSATLRADSEGFRMRRTSSAGEMDMQPSQLVAGKGNL